MEAETSEIEEAETSEIEEAETSEIEEAETSELEEAETSEIEEAETMVILKDDSASNIFSAVFSHDNTMKYWMDKKFCCYCFMLYARALSIIWSGTPEYWKWELLEESRGTMIEVAELKVVCWLEITGRFDTRKLTPGILYEVSFYVMMMDSAFGWEVPVTLRLVLPGGKKQEHRESLKDKMRGRWMDIPVGQFVACGKEDDGGDMEVSMRGSEGGLWKSGLVVKGVVIKPTYDK